MQIIVGILMLSATLAATLLLMVKSAEPIGGKLAPNRGLDDNEWLASSELWLREQYKGSQMEEEGKFWKNYHALESQSGFLGKGEREREREREKEIARASHHFIENNGETATDSVRIKKKFSSTSSLPVRQRHQQLSNSKKKTNNNSNSNNRGPNRSKGEDGKVNRLVVNDLKRIRARVSQENELATLMHSLPDPLMECGTAFFGKPYLPVTYWDAKRKPIGARIINGVDTNLMQLPFMVALVDIYNRTVCSGALIKQSVVITSARCALKAKEIGGHRLAVRAGMINPYNSDNWEEEAKDVEYYLIHPEFNETTNSNDLALAKLMSKFSNTVFIRTVCLPNIREIKDIEDKPGIWSIVSGFGPSNQGMITKRLQHKMLRIIDDYYCARDPDTGNVNKNYDRTRMMCASRIKMDSLSPVGSICDEDLGGPLVTLDDHEHWVIIGVATVDFKRTTCENNYGYFTKLTHPSIIKWLVKAINYLDPDEMSQWRAIPENPHIPKELNFWEKIVAFFG